MTEEQKKSGFDNLEILTKMKDLEVLILDSCYLKSIPDLSVLTKLKKLIIDSSYDLNKLLDLSPLQNLEELHLEDLDLLEIPEGLFKLKNLKRLHLEDVWTFDFKDPAPEDFAGVKKLKKLEWFKLVANFKNEKSAYEKIGTYLPKDCEYTVSRY